MDLLGVGEDAKAFARLVASKDVRPPLAIAIFGSWGSGKSFFMRLIHEHVHRLSEGTPDSHAPEAASENFHRGIAQIRFNAWHYSETNLWASLVDHLFTQLGTYVDKNSNDSASRSAVLDNLHTTRILTIESAERLAAQRKTQDALTKKLAEAEARRMACEREVMYRPSTYLDIIQKVFDSDDELKDAIDAAAHAVGITNVEAATGKVAEQLEAADSLVGEAHIAFNSVAKKLGGKLQAALAFACIPAALVLAWVLARGLQAINVPEVWTWLSQTVVSLGVLAASLKWLIGVATPVLTKMKVVKKAVEDNLAIAMKEHDIKLGTSKDELRQAEAQVTAAKQDLTASAESLVRAVEDFYGSSGTGRLLKFLRSRATDGHYAQHLGLIASVRRDFEELSIGMKGEGERAEMPPEELRSLRGRLNGLTSADSGLLAEDQRELVGLQQRLDQVANGAKNLKPPFSRLVLYIDDLDRCSHEKVIDVLQAVHMLMAFPLFTVFVAVDVRWLSQALIAQYGNMLTPLNAPHDRSQAGPHDYLEKIFQLPYWIEEVNESSGAKLIEGLIPIDDEDLVGTLEQHSANMASPTGELATTTVRSLKFTRIHRDLVGLFLPYFVNSPRKLLWFVNAFRVLKATSMPLSQADEEKQDFAIIMQLALASISPKTFQVWLAGLSEIEGPGSLGSMIDASSKLKASPAFWEAAHKAANRAEAEGYEDFDADMLRYFGRRAHRFCFSVPEPINPPWAAPDANVVA